MIQGQDGWVFGCCGPNGLSVAQSTQRSSDCASSKVLSMCAGDMLSVRVGSYKRADMLNAVKLL